MDVLIITDVTTQDVPAIQKIEDASFPSPWSKQTFHNTITDPRCKNMVAWLGDNVVGYCFALEMGNMVHLLNLAVKPECRRRGIGKRLLEELISFAQHLQKNCVLLEVRKGNTVAKALYRNLKFTKVCTWKRYYLDTAEDAEVMIREVLGRGHEGS
ncbi:MAG: ribosomal protein S18-alanine N-acetyltransferase [Deltaproteobacteria bacterium]|nr:ribosomal protein S18-alanine N-acetyltransferase [Deltaproteobacteria bacterium]